jgi:thymidylate synthase (FAD)
MTTESAVPFIKNAIKMGHFSVIEHEKATARVVCDRGVMAEFTRHRIGSFSVESTRYVNYKAGIEVIQPPIKDKIALAKWEASMVHAENTYRDMINLGETPEIARGVLPNSLRTEMFVTFNLREWRHFFWLRGMKGAHPQMREIAVLLLHELKAIIPAVFDDFTIDYDKNLIATKTLPAS